MRIFANCRELVSEIFRDVTEMGIRVHPHSMQNKIVEGNEDFSTLEINNYNYCLLSLDQEEFLFLFDPRNPAWVQAEFYERISPVKKNPGQAWKIREELWRDFLVDKHFDYTYNERLLQYNTLPRVIAELAKNPDSRQAIISIWDKSDVKNLGGTKRVPCSIYYQILIRENRVHLIYNQRSADVVTHFGNDVALAWMMKEYVKGAVNMQAGTNFESGYLYHNIGSLHCYKKDFTTLKSCVDTLI